MNINLTQREQAEMHFIDSLMAFNSVCIGPELKRQYQNNVEKKKLHISSMRDVADVFRESTLYNFSAFFERFNHKMIFQNTLSILEKRESKVLAWLDNTNHSTSTSALELQESLGAPSYYERVDIHTQPGGYHGSPYAGFLYHWMIEPFLVHRDQNDGMGWALAKAVPQRSYKDIMDMGCGIGKSTFPYCDLFPDAAVVGIDYAAPMLKYAHKLADKRKKKVVFRQCFAESTGYEDASFDLVVALWLFHELPRTAADAVISEAHRILRPGGTFAIMEGPPYKELEKNHSPLSAFMLDASGKRMSDPYLPGFFARDRVAMLKDGGFSHAYDKAVDRELAAEDGGKKNLFGPYPWWVTIGER